MVGSLEVDIVPVGSSFKAVYLTRGWGARKLLIGDRWSTINLGVRVRELRHDDSYTANLSGNIGFGLCSGISDPFGTVNPSHFLGVRTTGDWTRYSVSNWWQTGWETITGTPSGNVQHTSGTEGTIRVSLATDTIASAWYLRLQKLGGGIISMSLFLPTDNSDVRADDFELQLNRSVWNTSVKNHSAYREIVTSVAVDEGSLGPLDTFNIFSPLPDFVTSQLRGVEWLSAESVLIN